MWIVEHFELVKVCMTIELCSNGALVTGNDAIEVAWPHLQAIRMAWRYVADHMYFLVGEFSALQLVYEPLQLCRRICGI